MTGGFNIPPSRAQIDMRSPVPTIPKNNDHQLIILGNGFDLNCGLKSGFSSFFKSRMDLIEELGKGEEHEFFKAVKQSGLTLWDLILACRNPRFGGCKDTAWCDVEAAMTAVVVGDSDDSEAVTAWSINRYLSARSWMEYMHEKMVEAEREGDDEEIYHRTNDWEMSRYSFEDIEVSPSGKIARYTLSAFPEYESGEVGILQVLLDELRRLESEFDAYLRAVVAKTEQYEDSSSALLERLIESDQGGRASGGMITTILDFNYTTPKIPQRYQEGDVDIVNVHGKLGDEIVFGIDGTNHMKDMSLVRFTKTYRLLKLKTIESHPPIVHPPSGASLDAARTVAIKFYGHSLARADYSYFQSIFDDVDLYGGSVKLCFYFSDYCEDAEERQLLQVSNLLSAYGRTMGNKKHGKNLIHKLLLERRLTIQAI